MSCKETARRGAQEPRVRIELRKGDASDGADAAALVAEYGFTLDPWQRIVLDAWLSRAADDSPLYLTVGLACPRQNGKNGVIEAYELYKMVVCGERILHTAHQVKTANKAFQRLAAMFSDPAHPELCAMVANIRRTNGEQAIYLTNGGLIEYSARSRGASRGNTYSVVVLDEAQELTDEQVEALMPTLAASPTGYRQMVYTGTPPGPTSPGTVFARVRKSMLARPAESACWHEWGVGSIGAQPGSFRDVLDDVYAANPAMGIRLDEEFTENEFATMSWDGFARERLGWWSEQKAAAAIGRAEWAACGVPLDAVPRSGKKAFAVKFSVDGSKVALAACRLTEGGPAYVELVGQRPLDEGLSWITGLLCDERCEETTAAVAVDGKNGADALVGRLSGTYPRQALMLPGTKGVVASASMFLDAVRSAEVAHWESEGGEQAALDSSALASAKRPIGHDGGWGFGGDDSTAVEAAALALWAAKTTIRDPEGGCVVL